MLTATGALPETFAAEYDGGGMRARSTQNGVTTTYSFGLLEEVSGGGSTVYTPGVSQRQNGVDRFFHSDWIGSTRYLTDGTGLSAPTAYRFDAYGNVSAQAGPDGTNRKYAGGHGYESDGPAGMQLLGHRFYDPALGRFLNPDPIGFAGGLNLYAYCGGNPAGAVDPSGLKAWYEPNERGKAVGRWLAGAAKTVVEAPYRYIIRPLFMNVKMREDAVTWRNANPYYRPHLLRGGQYITEITDEALIQTTNNIGMGGLALAAVNRTACSTGIGSAPSAGDSVRVYRGFADGALKKVKDLGGDVGTPPSWADPDEFRLFVATEAEYAAGYGEVWTTTVPRQAYEAANDIWGSFRGTPSHEIGVPYGARNAFGGLLSDFFTGWKRL